MPGPIACPRALIEVVEDADKQRHGDGDGEPESAQAAYQDTQQEDLLERAVHQGEEHDRGSGQAGFGDHALIRLLGCALEERCCYQDAGDSGGEEENDPQQEAADCRLGEERAHRKSARPEEQQRGRGENELGPD